TDESKPMPAGLFASPRMTFFTNFGEVVVPAIGAELGWDLELAGGRVRVASAVHYYTSALEVTDRGFGVTSRIHNVPIDVSVLLVAPPAWLRMRPPVRFYGGLGAGITIMHGNIVVDGVTAQSTNRVLAGGKLTVGCEAQVSAGAFFLELTGGLSS